MTKLSYVKLYTKTLLCTISLIVSAVVFGVALPNLLTSYLVKSDSERFVTQARENAFKREFVNERWSGTCDTVWRVEKSWVY